MKQPDIINKRLGQKKENALTMLMKQQWNSAKYLQNEENPYLLNLSY